MRSPSSTAALATLLLLGACTGLVSEPGGGAGEGAVPATGIRRLGQAEVVAAATALLGVPADPLGAALGSDTRQSGFTRNADQRVSSVQADAVWQAAQDLAHTAVTQRLSTLAPCQPATGSEACARQFIHAFAGRAFRRLPTAAEEASLFSVYQAGSVGDTYAAGVELTIAAVLQSASFLYLTELGPPGAAGVAALTGEELATSLAFLLTGGPPADALLQQGRDGGLATAEARAAAGRALLATPEGHAQVQRLVLEWLGADGVGQSPKDAVLFPGWLGVRADVLAESQAIVDRVVFEGDGRLETLLSTDTTTVSPALASWYGLSASGTVPFPAPRRGLLLAAGFLASAAHPAATAPVKRGSMVRKRLLCQELTVPTNLGPINVPPPDPTRTTRERFAVHSQSGVCAGCHALLDPIGFALEPFDAAGQYRTTENGKPIDPSGTLVSAGDANGAFTDAVGLVQRLAPSATVRQCFPRQLYRFASGRSGGDEETAWATWVAGRPSATQGQVAELLVDWVQSDSFLKRRVP
jgi:hypothetical protein